MEDENNPQGLSDDDLVSMVMESPEEDTDDEPETDDTPDAEDEDEATEEAEDGQPDEEAEDDPEDDGEEAEDDEDPVIAWETKDGQSISVPLSELQNGYFRQQDYTRKTQEVAEARKSIEAEQESVRNLKTQLEQQLATWAVETEQEPDWLTLSQQMDPREFNYVRAQWDMKKARQEQAKAEYQRLVDQEKQQRMQDGAEKLKQLIPDLADPEKAPLVGNDMLLAAKHIGFSNEELAEIYDPRIFQGLHLISQFLKSQEQQKEVKKVANKKVAKAGKSLPAGKVSTKQARAEKKRQEAMERFRKTGSDEDFAAAIILG